MDLLILIIAAATPVLIWLVLVMKEKRVYQSRRSAAISGGARSGKEWQGHVDPTLGPTVTDAGGPTTSGGNTACGSTTGGSGDAAGGGC